MAVDDTSDEIESVSEIDEGKNGDKKECGGVIFKKQGATWIAVGSSSPFHSIEDRGHHLFGTRGSKMYVLDDTGSTISTGHHHISGVGPFEASTGAASYTLTKHMGVYVPDDPEKCRSLLNTTPSTRFPDAVLSALRDRSGRGIR